MSAGVPVVASPVGGIPEVVVDGVTRLPGRARRQADARAPAAQAACRPRARRAPRRRGARDRAPALFAPERAMRAIETVYESVGARAPPSSADEEARAEEARHEAPVVLLLGPEPRARSAASPRTSTCCSARRLARSFAWSISRSAAKAATRAARRGSAPRWRARSQLAAAIAAQRRRRSCTSTPRSTPRRTGATSPTCWWRSCAARASSSRCTAARRSSSPRQPTARRCARRASRWPDAVVVLSQAEAETFRAGRRRRPWRSWRTASIARLYQRHPRRRRPRQPLRLIYIGRLAEAQGPRRDHRGAARSRAARHRRCAWWSRATVR